MNIFKAMYVMKRVSFADFVYIVKKKRINDWYEILTWKKRNKSLRLFGWEISFRQKMITKGFDDRRVTYWIDFKPVPQTTECNHEYSPCGNWYGSGKKILGFITKWDSYQNI